MIWMIVGSMAAGLAGLLLYIYYWWQGHFDDEEEVKYQLFREEDPDS